jgi:hypothetical protein
VHPAEVHAVRRTRSGGERVKGSAVIVKIENKKTRKAEE